MTDILINLMASGFIAMNFGLWKKNVNAGFFMLFLCLNFLMCKDDIVEAITHAGG